MSAQINVTQIKSSIGAKPMHRKTLKGLGLSKLHQTRTLKDTPEVRGMIQQVIHLVKVEKA